MTLPFVSIVVPTRNRGHLLAGLLAALDLQDYPHYEVVVVDDASSDETPAILEEWSGERHLALRVAAPSGSYAARNLGWRSARGEIIAFTDDDCLPRQNWLSALVDAMQPNEVLGTQGVTVAGAGDITPFTHQIEQRSAGPPYRTCNVAYTRAVLERLGGFDESLRWYADNILGLRVSRPGTIAFAPRAIVHHPPRRREWRDRETWLERFKADSRHRAELRNLGGETIVLPGPALPLILWVLRPLLKQSRAHLDYLFRHPSEYMRQVGPLLGEKRELLAALFSFWGLSSFTELAHTRNLGARGQRTASDTKSLQALAPLPREPLVSVVIVTRDRPNLLHGVLQALERQTWKKHEMLVVDHGETGTAREAASATGSRYVRAAGLTLGAARQVGVDAARGDIVAFTDDDCVPEPLWLESLVAAFLRNPCLHGVQGRTEAQRGSLGAQAVRVRASDLLYQTCNMAYRQEALVLAGGFDTRFDGWFEDTALGARVAELGPIGFDQDAAVRHHAVCRQPMDRWRWYALLEDERRLADDYEAFYRRTRGPGFLATVVMRWLVGSPLKTLGRELWRAPREPRAYVRLVTRLLWERKELLVALVEQAKLDREPEGLSTN